MLSKARVIPSRQVRAERFHLSDRHRFLRCLPESLCRGALRTSVVNTRQIIFLEMDRSTAWNQGSLRTRGVAMAIALAVREEWLAKQGRSSSMKNPEAA